MRHDDSEPVRPSEPLTDDARAGPLIGRVREMAGLRRGLDDAVAGRGGLFLVGGEPGMGKSRLADELTVMARAQGAQVLWGRCWEAGGAPAYWPWVQVLRAHLRESGGPAGVPSQEAVPSDVGQVVSELVQLRGQGTAPRPAGADSARFAQFDAVTTYLTEAARTRPIVLILDDLQAADASSLLLLRFLAGQLAEEPLLVIGTFRVDDVAGQPELAAALSELTRQPTTRRFHLTGLDGPDVARFIESVTGVQPSAAVAAAIHQRTDGNPFFLSEISRLAAAEHRLHEAEPEYWERAVTQGVRELVDLRVDRLSRECARMLSVASVLGRDFALESLGPISGLAADELEELVDEAARAGLLNEAHGSPGLLRFSHEVIRDTLYDELPPSHRMRLHLRAGEALQALHQVKADSTRMAELAHHFFLAGPRAGIERIVESARSAADQSLALLAYEEAVRLYRMALTALGWADSPDAGTECDLQLAAADAWSRAGDFVEAGKGFLRAAELAKGLGRDEALARAALGYGGRFVWLRGSADPHLIPLLEDALATVGEEETHLRVRLMTRVAAAKRDELDRGPRDALSRETVQAARLTGDRALLAYALVGRHAAMLGPSHAPGAHGPPDELLEIAREIGNQELQFEGGMHQLVWHLERTEVGSAVRTLEELAEIARRLQEPTHSWFVAAARASLALLRGDLAAGEALVADAARIGTRAVNWDPRAFADVQLFILRREQGRLAEMRAHIEASVDAHPTRPLFPCMLAALCLELGDDTRAAAILDDLAADDFKPIPLNNDWALSTTLLAEVVHGLDDRRRARVLYEAVLPAAESCVDTMEVSTGAVSRTLGLLALTDGRPNDAVDHLEAAVATNERIGARPWAAHARHALARALLSRADSGDAVAARTHLDAALATARDVGQVTLVTRVEGVLRDLDGRRDLGHARPSAAPERHGTFRREGDYWLVGLDGVENRLRDIKGLRHLAMLIAASDREIHALDLTGSIGGAGGNQPRTGRAEPELVPMMAAGADEVLDHKARAAYRERIETLQAELEEAESWNDAGRASAAQAELEFLIQELTDASGLGGKSRTFTSDAERARVNATRAIRSAIERIREHDPDLSWHLDRCVRTGTFCCYERDREASVVWSL